MKKYILSAIIILSVTSFTACDKSEDLPPKTENSSTSYLLPKGTIMTNAERALCTDKENEYKQATK